MFVTINDNDITYNINILEITYYYMTNDNTLCIYIRGYGDFSFPATELEKLENAINSYKLKVGLEL